MGLMDMFRQEARDSGQASEAQEAETSPELSSALLSALMPQKTVTRETAEGIPSYAACVDTIADTVAALPIRLYRRDGDSVTEITDDPRVALLNGETGDTMTAFEMKSAMVRDYYGGKGGFAYVHKVGNRVRSLHYVDPGHVGILKNSDPIFKSVQITVDGASYKPWQFIVLARNTEDGVRGRSIVSQCSDAFGVATDTMRFERSQAQRGGAKRGFLKSARKLTDHNLSLLRSAFRRLYSSNEENFVVLNDGVEFQEASETSLEMQLKETKQENSKEIFSAFKVPPGIIQGGATESDRDNFVRYCLMPLIAHFKAAIDAALLLEDEKGSLYFDFDLTEYSKANMKDRWEAWANAKDKGLVQVDEFRSAENLQPLGMDYVNMGLNDVLFDVAKKQLIVPNMGQVIDLETMEVLSSSNPSIAPKGTDGPNSAIGTNGGEKNEADDQE